MELVAGGKTIQGFQMGRFGNSGAHAQWSVVAGHARLCCWEGQVWDESALLEFADHLRDMVVRMRMGVE